MEIHFLILPTCLAKLAEHTSYNEALNKEADGLFRSGWNLATCHRPGLAGLRSRVPSSAAVVQKDVFLAGRFDGRVPYLSPDKMPFCFIDEPTFMFPKMELRIRANVGYLV